MSRSNCRSCGLFIATVVYGPLICDFCAIVKPCPLCNEPPKIHHPIRSTFEQYQPSVPAKIACHECGLRLEVSAMEDAAMAKAIERWNRRKGNDVNR